jgi:hypothetical protein
MPSITNKLKFRLLDYIEEVVFNIEDSIPSITPILLSLILYNNKSLGL